jgi:hypothetical protein
MGKLEIWKFPVSLGGVSVVEMPKDAKILSFQAQGPELCLWALVSPDSVMEQRAFKIYGTGHSITGNPGTFIGTTQQGPFVWHLFE